MIYSVYGSVVETYLGFKKLLCKDIIETFTELPADKNAIQMIVSIIRKNQKSALRSPGYLIQTPLAVSQRAVRRINQRLAVFV